MQLLHRAAAVVTAAAVAPALFLATPAAAAQGAQYTQGPRSPQNAPAAKTAEPDPAKATIRLQVKGLPTEIAADGAWHRFKLVLDNRKGAVDIEKVKRSALIAFHENRTATGFDMQYREGGAWKRWDVRKLRGWATGPIGYQKVAAGSVTTVPMRIRFKADAILGGAFLIVHAGTDKEQKAYSIGSGHRFRIVPAAPRP
ncbi:hypothetical protein [Streptomyces sp. NBC_00239]|uniref:hypothetical protein n=1 Tax=Streptomyces sp. NBC_00239 TaxID=2903640 RepID=UPI002E2C9631|nr:hypothetical protein [Streptomyces sp. NBC_00239]